MHGVKIDDLTVKIKLSGERQGITSGRIKTVADEFREDIDIGATREKIGKGIAEREGGYHFRGRQIGADGANPRTEGTPNQCGKSGREILEPTLRDDADLDMAMVGVQLAKDGLAIFHWLEEERLIAGRTDERHHFCAPEMIGIDADGVQRLLEG